MKTKILRQDGLTGECWIVQMQGLKACESCQYKGTEDCGGEDIRRTGKNEKGHHVGEDGI